MVPLLQGSAIFSLNLNSFAKKDKKYFFKGHTNREGALIHYYCQRGEYYKIGRTNREGRSNLEIGSNFPMNYKRH